MNVFLKFQKAFLFGGIFAFGLFIYVHVAALFRLEPFSLREPWIYFVSLLGGLVFGLLIAFDYLIPYHSLVIPLLGLTVLLASAIFRYRSQ
jgi:hypothetical protein